jgi:hypothetical protein
LKEKRVFLTGRWTQAKGDLLRELYENIRSASKNTFFFDQFDYGDIIRGLTGAGKEDGYVFIAESLRFSYRSMKEETANLLSLLRNYPNLSFYIGTEYGGFESENQSESLFHMFKVAELVSVIEIKQQNKNAPPVEEEVIQQKVEPVENIVQKKEKAPKSKKKAGQFQATRTKYDDVFLEIINGSEFLEIKQAERFLFENELEHFNSLAALHESRESSGTMSIARVIDSRLMDTSLSLEEFGREFASFEFWNAIALVVADLSKAYTFARTKEDNPKSYPVLERKWASEFLRMFIAPGSMIALDLTIRNYISFLESPHAQPYIIEEPIKQQVVEKILGKEYTRENFTQYVWGYFESLSQNNPKNPANLGYFIASVLLHPKIRSIWDDAQQNGKTPPPLPSNDGRLIGKYSPDEASEEDHLGFKHDVHALAALVAYDKTPLPLAIGLFGNWGSGKSSFMKQLEKRIDELSTEQYKNTELTKSPDGAMPYCTNITHITFNAWHYSDGNLWASMMVHIFDELLEKIAASKTREQLRAELLKNLTTASEAVVEAEKRVLESTSKLTVAKDTLKAIEGQRENINTELANVKLSLNDVFGTLMKDPQFSSTIQHLAKESGYDKVIENKQQLEKWKSEMDSFGERLIKAYKNFYKANKVAAVLVVALPVLLSALFVYLYKTGTLENINAAIVTATVSVMPFLGKMMGQVRKINISLSRLESLQKEKVDKKEMELKEREKFIIEEIKQHEATVAQRQQEVEIAKKEKEDAQAALDAIDINRQLTSFIQQRQGGNSYQQHLGIISLIRKDFGELRKFLKASNKEKKPQERIIERIVLYIDDLDRCKTDRVVAVLEAVHLLLAFDLFVVVVGVDPRWVSKALKEQYKEQLHLDAAEDSDTSRLPGQRATPFDYLEKIFQVPFVLRSMDNSGAKKLLDNLFKDQVKKKDAEVVIDTNIYANASAPMLLNRTAESGEKEPTPEEILAAAKQSFEAEIEKKKKLEEEAQKEFIEQVENLTISEQELEFMKSIAPIIGATPRTVKRYGNLYRLLRVHNDIPNYSPESLPVYQSVMLLLSISVSNGSIARSFFNALKESKKAGFYEVNVELVSAVQTAVNALNKLEEKDEETKEKWESLTEQLQSLIQLKDTLGKLPDEVKNFSVATLKKHSPVVSRFSFRTLNCVEEEEIARKA